MASRCRMGCNEPTSGTFVVRFFEKGLGALGKMVSRHGHPSDRSGRGSLGDVVPFAERELEAWFGKGREERREGYGLCSYISQQVFQPVGAALVLHLRLSYLRLGGRLVLH